MKRPELTREFLEELYRKHHRLENLNPDPLIFARGYDDPLEGEIAGLIAGVFAYGNVKQIVKNLTLIFDELGEKPREAILSTEPNEWPKRFPKFAYRFHKTQDISLFFWLLRQALEQNSSLVNIFTKARYTSISENLSAFTAQLLSGDARPLLPVAELPKGHPVRHLVSSPANGGAAKRMCLFLRWMVRSDALDPGYWHGLVASDELVVPLDVHVGRVGRHFGLTRLKSPGWKMAKEITESLKEFDPEDPLRYDFTLFRYGMEEIPPEK
ncbi:MAG: TIGR02757 family protein [Deltaproteobacteria bacterium]|mgnify:CR=1 FL=1|nr:MAG: TIGR02757 family protein [Deltaproteobacteria bacterium]